MPRIYNFNPRFKGGMIKTFRGLRPVFRKMSQSFEGSGVRTKLGQCKHLSIREKKTKSEDIVEGGKIKSSVKPLKFLM